MMFLSLLKFQQTLWLSTVQESFCWLEVGADQINGSVLSSVNGKKIDLAVQVGLVTRE